MRHLASGLLLLVVTLSCLIAGELVLRAIDGYEVWALSLRAGPQAVRRDSTNAEAADGYAARLPVSWGVDRAWFRDPPPPALQKPRSELLDSLVAQAEVAGKPTFDAIKIWNRNLFIKNICRNERAAEAGLAEFLPQVLTFDPPDDSYYPTFRYLPNTTLPVGGPTNAFGLRGDEISLNKPASTIRIAFVGASTTENAYPEWIRGWLKTWASANEPGIKIETVNAGRSGFQSSDIAAVVRTELAPLAPDLVVYYEGANQFYFANLLELDDPSASLLRSAATLQEANQRALDDPVNRITAYSATARRLLAALGHLGGPEISELPKPRHRLKWPPHIDELNPDLTRGDLPLGLSNIVKDLDAIRFALSASGGELVPSTFVHTVFDGMRMEPVRDATLFRALNTNWRYWPATYAEVERMAAFQNRVLRKYARLSNLALLDIDAQMPKDPRFTTDGVHFDWDAARLHAWIAFNGLVTLLRERIAAGALPRADPRRAIGSPGVHRSPVVSVVSVRRARRGAIGRSAGGRAAR